MRGSFRWVLVLYDAAFIITLPNSLHALTRLGNNEFEFRLLGRFHFDIQVQVNRQAT